MDFSYANKRSINMLIRNDLVDGGNWLKVKLISPFGQIGAFGAKTRLYLAGEAGSIPLQLRESRSAYGYLAQDDPVLHFGLGDLSSVDVEVTFLDGTVAVQSNVQANQTIVFNGTN
jgi:hypothetical protein